MIFKKKIDYFLVPHKNFDNKLEFFLNIAYKDYKLIFIIYKFHFFESLNLGELVYDEYNYLVFSINTLNELNNMISIISDCSVINFRILGIKESYLSCKEDFYSYILSLEFYQTLKILRSDFARKFIILYFDSENFAEFETLFIHNDLYSKYYK